MLRTTAAAWFDLSVVGVMLPRVDRSSDFSHTSRDSSLFELDIWFKRLLKVVRGAKTGAGLGEDFLFSTSSTSEFFLEVRSTKSSTRDLSIDASAGSCLKSSALIG